jgi:hypothetical protein
VSLYRPLFRRAASIPAPHVLLGARP